MMPLHSRPFVKTALCATVSLAMAVPVFAAPASVVQSLSVSSPAPKISALPMLLSMTETDDGGLTATFSGPIPARPTFFRLASPATVVADVSGGTCGGAAFVPNAQAKHPLLGAQCVQGSGRARFVVHVPESVSYNVTAQGDVLMMTPVDGKTPTPASPVPPASEPVSTPIPSGNTFAPDTAKTVQAITDIDFHRGPNNIGQILVRLPSTDVGVTINTDKVNGDVLVDFPKTTLPTDLARRLDVINFGTPVQTVTTFSTPNGVRMVIHSLGEIRKSAYQAGTEFVLQIEPKSVADAKSEAEKAKKEYTGQRLSLNFQNIDLRSLLQVFADFTHMNIVVSDSVTGSLTLRLQNVPWDQALAIILQAKNLGKEVHGNVMWVAPKEQIAKQQQEQYAAEHAAQSTQPLESKVFQLNYQKAATVVAMLTGAAGGAQETAAATPSPSFNLPGAQAPAATTRILSPRGAVFADARTNQLFVTDIPSKIEAVKTLLKAIDKPVAQVLIEARIVEANTSFGRELGARLGLSGGFQPNGNYRPGLSINGSADSALTTAGTTGTTTTSAISNAIVDLPAATLANTLMTGVTPGALAISLFNASASRMIGLEISALQNNGTGKVIAEPRVITADSQTADIEQGTEIPYQQSTSSGATSVSFKKAVLSLQVTPQITPDGGVIMKVEIHKDSVGQNTSAGPAINTNTLKTQVQIENGGTVVLGGIYTSSSQDQTDKVPFLGDVPVLGNLFKTNSKAKQTDELLIFLTPKIIPQQPFNTALQGANALSGQSDQGSFMGPGPAQAQ